MLPLFTPRPKPGTQFDFIVELGLHNFAGGIFPFTDRAFFDHRILQRLASSKPMQLCVDSCGLQAAGSRHPLIVLLRTLLESADLGTPTSIRVRLNVEMTEQP